METTQELQQLAVLVNEVKKRFERVREDVGNVHLVFLNRYEEVDYVNAINDESAVWDSHMELRMRAGHPCWEICTVQPAKNEIFIQSEWHATEDVTDDLLSEAVRGGGCGTHSFLHGT